MSTENYIDHLSIDWQHARRGDERAQSQWEAIEGDWSWHDEGLQLRGTGAEWVALRWRGWEASNVKRFRLSTIISGTAEAAGISFGPYQDFLARLDPQTTAQRIELDVDVEARCWAFYVDGRLMDRQWWDNAVGSVDDIVKGEFRLKARHPENVWFRDLELTSPTRACQLSVIITAHKFLQRLRLSLRHWCHQEVSPDLYEVLIVNPQSPDGTHEHLGAVSRSYPHIRLREISVPQAGRLNKGAMINRACAATRGEWIWLTDADCLFGIDSAARVLQKVADNPQKLLFGQRRYLSAIQTDALLSGRVDSLQEFDRLAAAAGERAPELHPWGYTQIIHNSTLRRLRYPESQNHFAHSDGMFAESCRRDQITPEPIEGLFCLHLDHPFAWYGTGVFL